MEAGIDKNLWNVVDIVNLTDVKIFNSYTFPEMPKSLSQDEIWDKLKDNPDW